MIDEQTTLPVRRSWRGDGRRTVPFREVDARTIREQTEKILAHKLFCQSWRYSSLLRFVVEQTLDVTVVSVKERTVGIEVFGKAPDYDTSVDPTVRVAATEVRKRLSLYYQHPIHASEVRIDLPVRSYLAEFTFPEPAQPASPTIVPQVTRRSGYTYLSAAVLLALASLLGIELFAPAPALQRFWAPFLSSPVRSIICIGSPPSGPQASINDSVRTEFAEPGKTLSDLSRTRTKPAVVDATVGAAIASFLGRNAKDSVLRIAPDTSLGDLRVSPIVTLGAFSNDWAMRLGAQLPIRLSRVSDSGVRWIVDTSEKPNRKWYVDMSAPSQDLTTDYALISRIYDQNTGQWWIGLAGLTGLGTIAASDFVTDSHAIATMSSGLPKHWEQRNVQMVLAIKVVNGSPASPKLVDVRSW